MWPYSSQNQWGGFAYPPQHSHPEQYRYPPQEWPRNPMLDHCIRYPGMNPPPPRIPPPVPQENMYYLPPPPPPPTQAMPDTDLRYSYQNHTPNSFPVKSALFPSAINAHPEFISSEKTFTTSSFESHTIPPPSEPRQQKKALPTWLRLELEKIEKNKRNEKSKVNVLNDDDMVVDKQDISGSRWLNDTDSENEDDERGEHESPKLTNQKLLISSSETLIPSNLEKTGSSSHPFSSSNDELMDFQIAWSRLSPKERQAESAKFFTNTLTTVMLDVTSEMLHEIVNDLFDHLKSKKEKISQTQKKPKNARENADEDETPKVAQIASSLVAYGSEDEDHSSDDNTADNPLAKLIGIEPSGSENTSVSTSKQNSPRESRPKKKSGKRSSRTSSSSSNSDSSSSEEDSTIKKHSKKSKHRSRSKRRSEKSSKSKISSSSSDNSRRSSKKNSRHSSSRRKHKSRR